VRDITLEDTFYVLFTTRAFATGIPTVLAGTPVVSAYENDSATQITAGITLGVDHDSVAGLNLLTIVATGANGYEAGKDYSLVITTGTVGGVSVVGEVVGEFSIGRSAAAVDLANATDGLGALKTLIDTIDTVVDAIKVVTDKFVFTVANQVDANALSVGGTAQTAGDLAALITTLDTVADAIKVVTDKFAFTVANVVDANLLNIDGSAPAAANLKQSTLGIVTGVIGAASTTTNIVTSSLAPAAAVIDQFKGKIITFAEDTTTTNLRGQSSDITSNTALGVLTVTALTTAPVSGDTFSIT